MKKYVQPTFEVINMEVCNSIMSTSGGTLGQQGELQDGQSILSSRRRGDAWTSYEDR
jgi:hypothetical protein